MTRQKERSPDTRTPLPGQRITEFTDSAGRQLSSGDLIRVTTEPQSRKFKIRHLFRTPEGVESIEVFGPYDRYGNLNYKHTQWSPQYRSFALDQVSAKCRD